MYTAGTQLDSYTADACGWPVEGFVADPKTYPGLDQGNIWRRWWKLIGVQDPTRTVLCGVTLPNLSGDLDLAKKAATLAGTAGIDSPDPADVCNYILDRTGYTPEPLDS